MAPVSELRQRRAVRVSQKRDFEVVSSVWPWTVGDDSESEDDARLSLKAKRRVRRQEAPPAPPAESIEGDIPASPPPGVELDGSPSSSESDGITSNTSGEEDEVEDGVTTPDLEAPPAAGGPSQSVGEPQEQTTSSSSSVSQATSSSRSAASSTSTVSQSFTTLIPGSAGEPVSESDSASRTLTLLTPVLTVVEPETTYTSYSVWTTLDEASSAQWSTVTSDSSTATRAAQTSAAADADSSPTPQIIRIHEHPHGLSKDAIHGLIAFGALGGLMGVLAVAWFFWRRHQKKNQDFTSQKSSDDGFSRPWRGISFLAHVPFLKERFANRGWFNIDEPYYKDNNNSRTSVYLEKSISVKSTSAPRLDSQFFAPNQVMGVAVRVQAGDNPPAVSHNMPAGGGLGHHPVGSISSTNPQRSNTVRNREPPFPVSLSKRASELSSLSSGFGDGDLLVPNGQSTMERLPQPPPSAKFPESVTSRRDTVYTEASEDQPPRFRNVNSWVRQQTGRVKRSQARAQAEDAPPVPQMPTEENYGMMLPDGEEPRRPQVGAQ